MNKGPMNRAELRERFDAFINAPRSAFWTEYIQVCKWRFKVVAGSIPCSSETLKILEIGPTDFTLLIKAVYPHYEVCALDLTNGLKDRCDAAGIQLKVCNLDQGYIPFEDSCFDVVLFCEVLEHTFARPTEILNEIGRIMRPQGKLILTVPNIATLHRRIIFLFGISPLQHPDIQMSKPYHGHVHEYTMKEITSLLENCNFRILQKKYVPINGLKVRLIRRLVRGIYHAAQLLIPSWRPFIVVVCCKQVENE